MQFELRSSKCYQKTQKLFGIKVEQKAVESSNKFLWSSNATVQLRGHGFHVRNPKSLRLRIFLRAYHSRSIFIVRGHLPNKGHKVRNGHEYHILIKTLTTVKENKTEYFDSDEVALRICLHIAATSAIFRR